MWLMNDFVKKNIVLEAAFVIVAIIAGFNFQLNWFSLMWDADKYITIKDFAQSDSWALHGMKWRLIVGSTLTPIVLFVLRYLIRSVLVRLDAFKNSINEYCRYDTIAYLPLMLTCTGYFGIKIDFFIIFLLFILIQLYLIFVTYTEHKTVDMDTDQLKNTRLFVLFFISGFAALIYQVVWQRALFRFFGVNIESVTVIVSIFMLGLGLGALIGGYLSKTFPNHLPHLFVICEGVIGVFGFFSLQLFGALTVLTLHSSQFTITLTIYGFLALPTLCMGATLPLLIEYFHRTIRKVGKTVSFLYFINTFGSALASFFTVEILFLYFGMQFAAIFASLCNLFVALMGMLFIRKYGKKINYSRMINKVAMEPDQVRRLRIRFYLILVLSCLTGYVAMSQEILWIRYISFATGGKTDVFANLVGSILVGIALGSIMASSICEKYKERLMTAIALSMFMAALLYFVSIPLLSHGITKMKVDYAILSMYLCSGFIALLMGISLPILSHYAVRSYSDVGMSVSWIYFANIVGSTVGPIVTGFFLLDWFGFEKNVLFLSVLTWSLSVILWLANIKSFSLRQAYQPILVLCSLLVFVSFSPLYKHTFEKLQWKDSYMGQSFKYLIQNRSGVITVSGNDSGGDMVSGGGIYDGRMNTSLKTNSNIIERAYMFAALKLKPESVLEIGLSTGSWTRVMANHQDVRSLEVVEINPGYIELISKYPEQGTILGEDKIKIHIDDGRRWLLRVDRKFDIIVMNTTYFWRSQINNLVSKEFFLLCKARLKEGGVMYLNTTGSPDIPYTLANVFAHVIRYSNFVAGSDQPFPFDSIQKRESLSKFFVHDKPVFDERDSEMLRLLNKYASEPLNDVRRGLLGDEDRYLITDDNLASEFKTINKPYIKKRSWYLIFC